MKKGKLQVKGIILDLDGTLVDSKEAYKEAAKTAFSALGKNAFDIHAVAEIPKRFEQGIPLDGLIPANDVDKFTAVYLRTYYQATIVKTKPLPNVADTLRKLSEKAKLALSTRRNVPKKEVIEQLEKFGLALYFQVVMTAADRVNPKPSPDTLIECCRKLGVGAIDCIVVGDSVVDVRAGKRAGARTVAVLSGIFSRKELEMERPDLILEGVWKLPNFLK